MKTSLRIAGRYSRIALALAVLAGLLLPAAAWAQNPPPPQPGQQPKEQPQQQPRRPWDPPAQGEAQPQPGAAPVDPAEDADYWAFLAAPNDDPKRLIELGEGFIEKYPESRYREFVYSRLASAFLANNNVEKMMEVGEKALALNPDNVDVLALLSWVMPRRIGQGLDAEQTLQKSERYAKHAVSLLENLTKPETLTEEQFTQARDEKLSMCHSGLGLVFYHRQRYADSAAEFEKATTLSPNPEPVDIYLLGLAYANSNRFADAANAFGRCAQIQWDWQQRCRSSQAEAQQRAAGQLQPPSR